jgi:hypothetical protein
MDYHPHIIHNGTYLKNVKGKPFSMLIKKKKSLIERKAYFYDYKKAFFKLTTMLIVQLNVSALFNITSKVSQFN